MRARRTNGQTTCAKCLIAPRLYKTSAYCKECIAEYARKWYESHPTKYYSISPEARLIATKRWQKNNPEKYKAYQRRYREQRKARLSQEAQQEENG